jgi:OOP family OmpA-OmpF porin
MKIVAAAVAAPLLMLATQARAQTVDPPTGVYVGAGITRSHFDADNFTIDDIDNNDNSWKAIVGFRPHRNFALEANYIDFGKASAPAIGTVGPFEVKAKGYGLYGVGLAPMGPVDLYLKAGLARLDADGNMGAVVFEDKKTEFAYGAGLQFRLTNFAIRAEYEKYDTDVVGDLDLITLGATYTFGPR